MTSSRAPRADDNALVRLRRAAEGGRDADAWASYVAALRAAGQKGRARKVAKSAPLPGLRKALGALAEGRAVAGILPGAVVASLTRRLRAGQLGPLRAEAATVLQHYPDAPEILRLLGIAALMEDDLIEAEIRLRRAFDGLPDDADTLSNLGLAVLGQGRAREAITLMQPAAAKGDAPATLKLNLAAAYLRDGQPRPALELADAILAATPDDADALGLAFAALFEMEEIDTATRRWADLTPDLQARLADARIELLDRTEGRTAALAGLQAARPGRAERERMVRKLSTWGEFDAAARLLREGIDAGEGGPQAFRTLGQISTWREGDPLLDRLRQEAARRDQPPGRRATLLLARAKAEADLGDHGAAFATIQEGKAIWADAVPYDPAAEWSDMHRQLAQWPAARVAELGRTASDGPRPVFIIGLPRSGSTLIETRLARHPLVRSLGESPRAFGEAARAGPNPRDIGRMRDALDPLFAPRIPGERVTDKLFANFRMVGPLLAAFPEARFLFPDRDCRATGLSIFENPFSPVDAPWSLTPERIAQHIVNCTRMVAEWEARFPQAVRRVSYEALVSDPDTGLPALADAAGLNWDAAMRDDSLAPARIDTFSLAQARAPITRASVERWRRHEADLAPMIAILGEAGLIPQET